MDNDVFAKVNRVGLQVVEAVERALAGEAWDPSSGFRYVAKLWGVANGVPSLPWVLAEFEEMYSSPLLAGLSSERDRAAERIDEATSSHPDLTKLDLVLRTVATRFAMRSDFRAHDMVRAFLLALLDHGIVSSRGGVCARQGNSHYRAAKELLAPIADEAAFAIMNRPDARRLRLGPPQAEVRPDTNLLGGSS